MSDNLEDLRLKHLSEKIRNLQRIYARSAHSRDFSCEAYRRRMDLAEQIQELMEGLTLEQQQKYDIW